MKSFSGLSKPFRKLALYECMYILGVRVYLKLSAVYICKYAFKSLNYSFGFAFFDYSALAYHLGMRDTALYILTVHTAVKAYG